MCIRDRKYTVSFSFSDVKTGNLLLHQNNDPSLFSGLLIMQRNIHCQKWVSSLSFNLNESIKSNISLKASEFSSSKPGSKHKMSGFVTIFKLILLIVGRIIFFNILMNCGLTSIEQYERTGNKPGNHIESSLLSVSGVNALKIVS